VEAVIAELEGRRRSRLVCYATSDRKGQETQIGNDALPVLYGALAEIGKVPRLDLLLYSRGGDTLTGFTLANALREFGTSVSVLVPFRANSCATLIALGADEIVMGPFGQLSPIDPSITTPHGPSIDQGGQQTFLPVSVEDVANYFALARNEAGLSSEDHMAQVFGHLSVRISPLALGAVYRAREQIGMLADKLLSLHMTDDARRKRIAQALTRELLSHDYTLGRREAKILGLPIVDAGPDEASLMWEVYEWMAKEMQLSEPFLPQPGTVVSTRGLVLSGTRKSGFVSSYSITKTSQTLSGGQKQDVTKAEVVGEGWKAI
jgi:Serine dehydrogenase proteinase